MTMTLVEASKLLDEWANVPSDSVNIPTEYLRKLKSSVDAHMAWMGEPVAWTDPATLNSARTVCIKKLSYRSIADVTAGVEFIPLYAGPPINIAVVREVIAELRVQPFIDMDIDRRMVLADKLTAALPKET